jgi:hypothetical protein
MTDRCRVRLIDACKRLARPVGWICIYAGIVLGSIGLSYTFIGWISIGQDPIDHSGEVSCFWGIAILILAYAIICISWGLLRRRNVSGIYARKRIGGYLILIGLALILIRAGVYIASRRVPLDYVQTIKSWEDLASAEDRWWDSTADEVRDHYKKWWIFKFGESAVDRDFQGMTQKLFKTITQIRERVTRSNVQQTYDGVEFIGIIWLLVGLVLRYAVDTDEPHTEIDKFIETKRFLDAGNDPNGKKGRTRLHIACLYGDVAVAALLLDSGADANMATSLVAKSLRRWDSDTPLLHTAAERDNPDIIDLLIESGATVNLEDDNGNTPLHIAAGYSNKVVVWALLNGGANIHAKNNEGETPYDVAIKNKKTELTEILGKTVDINRNYQKNRSPQPLRTFSVVVSPDRE